MVTPAEMDASLQAILARLEGAEVNAASAVQEGQRLQAELSRRDEADQRRRAEEAARARVLPMTSLVDTKITQKPEPFSGREVDWPQYALLMRAYVGAISPRMYELLLRAEDPEASLDRVDLEPGDEHLDSQLHYMLTMTSKGTAQNKASLVAHGEGLLLWRHCVAE